MQRLIEQSADAGMRQMIAVIAQPSSSKASVALHQSLGFDEVGVFRAVGEKFGQALDVLLMYRSLIEARLRPTIGVCE